ncbi:AraC family transcriptional regulator [Kordia periserrulae]|uniref:AraC family transcriptional regulator n=1 Tax=Kordia periserrulae TaxID=701523 RepID=A0A2T6C394_9FLAO|nr:GyrI-like domain-containing protein [Kordia periserrulae]PTX62791.1 AraC family transcriptional regulator [Kordia periserrulae]
MITFKTTQTLPQKKLVGKSMRMSLMQNTTPQLWKSFMQLRNSIKNAVGSDLYSLQVYDEMYFDNFNPQTEFTKYALTAVSDFESIPDEMEAFTLESGLYAVFLYQGLPQNFAEAFQYIFQKWLPNSEYTLDNRPHFEVLGAAYNPTSETSQEEVWIPIRI